MVAGEGFEPLTVRLCMPLQLSLPGDSSLWSGLSLHPRTGFAAVRMPAIKSLHLLTNRAGSVSLARDYPATGFPDSSADRRRQIGACGRAVTGLVSA